MSKTNFPVHLVSEMKPLAKYRDFIIDEQGVLKRINTELDLPIIKMNLPDIHGGEKIGSDEIGVILTILSLNKKYELEVRSAAVYNRERMELKHKNGTVVLLNFSSEPNKVAASLQMLFSRFKIEGRIPKIIDFRFKNPVVKF